MASILPQTILGQQSTPLLTIQHTELQDSVVIREVKKLITEDIAGAELVREGMGYINLFEEDYHGKNSSFSRKYEFFMSFSPPKEDWPAQAYPLFYTYISGRLVLINLGGIRHSVKLVYSTKSKKHLRKLIKPFVAKPQKLVFRDLNGKKVFTDKHAQQEPIRFDSGKVVYIRKDGTALVRRANDFSPVE